MLFNSPKIFGRLFRLLLAGLSFALVLTGTAYAQAFFSGVPNSQTSATLNLTGNVASVLQVKVDAETVASNLDLTTNFSESKVATVGERTNNNAGYTVAVASTNLNDGNCQSSSPCFYSTTTGENLPFTVTKGSAPGSGITFSGGSATWSDTTSKTSGSGDTADLNISYDGTAEFLSAASDYVETLTFTITAK